MFQGDAQKPYGKRAAVVRSLNIKTCFRPVFYRTVHCKEATTPGNLQGTECSCATAALPLLNTITYTNLLHDAQKTGRIAETVSLTAHFIYTLAQADLASPEHACTYCQNWRQKDTTPAAQLNLKVKIKEIVWHMVGRCNMT